MLAFTTLNFGRILQLTHRLVLISLRREHSEQLLIKQKHQIFCYVLFIYCNEILKPIKVKQIIILDKVLVTCNTTILFLYNTFHQDLRSFFFFFKEGNVTEPFYRQINFTDFSFSLPISHPPMQGETMDTIFSNGFQTGLRLYSAIRTAVHKECFWLPLTKSVFIQKA